MKLTLTLLAAAALTLWLSPSLRGAALRLLFLRDFPITPYDFEPKFRVARDGALIDEPWS